MKKLLKKYKKISERFDNIKNEITEKFGLHYFYGECIIFNECQWNTDEYSIFWLDEESMYSVIIIEEVGEFENYIMYKVDDQCGSDLYFMILDKILKTKI